jgi:ATP-dependent DNA helicase RecG
MGDRVLIHKNMKRQSVESSNLASIGYDAENEILEIEFNHGGVYQYFDVPENVYEELMNADSHGVYFLANIRNDYEYEKM